MSVEELGCGRLEAGSPRDTVAWTPLQYACALGDAELVSELIAANPESANALGNVSRFLGRWLRSSSNDH